MRKGEIIHMHPLQRPRLVGTRRQYQTVRSYLELFPLCEEASEKNQHIWCHCSHILGIAIWLIHIAKAGSDGVVDKQNTCRLDLERHTQIWWTPFQLNIHHWMYTANEASQYIYPWCFSGFLVPIQRADFFKIPKATTRSSRAALWMWIESYHLDLPNNTPDGNGFRK